MVGCLCCECVVLCVFKLLLYVVAYMRVWLLSYLIVCCVLVDLLVYVVLLWIFTYWGGCLVLFW